jgi:OFA family oxalate/formate antiporter-like MFS transporter
VSLQAFLVYVVPYSIHAGISQASASTALAIVGIFSVIGRIGMGPVSDLLGRTKSLAVVYILISVGVLLLSLASTLVLVYSVSIIMGLALGGIISGNLTAVGDIFESESLGRIIGIQSSAFGLGGMIGPVASGFVLDSLGDYHPVFWIASVCAVAATIVILLGRKVH